MKAIIDTYSNYVYTVAVNYYLILSKYLANLK